ncbi:MAG: helix-turn-helix domain-containing protein [Planctomycetes bacterium]|nr:helix-turn-helix domain-containing protein [Planctomycetota bacterium]
MHMSNEALTITPEPLLLSATETAELLGVGRSHLYSLHSAGRLPLPVRLGRRVLWRRSELEQWIKCGCPARSKWVAMEGDRP